MLLGMLIFSVIAAFVVAKLEIQIEGKNGWAEHLPTYKFSNPLSHLIMGNTPMTGYHVWLNATFVTFIHFPFFVGLAWTLPLELRFFGIFFFGAVLEDFFWFIFNPRYGLRKFNAEHAPWHRWIGGLPMLYYIYLFLAIVLTYLSYLL